MDLIEAVVTDRRASGPSASKGKRPLRRGRPRSDVIWALTATMVAVAGATWALLPPSSRVGIHHWSPVLAFVLLCGAFSLTEIFVVHLQFRRDAHTFSLLEVPLVLGLIFASPPVTVLALIVGGGITLTFHRRQPTIKLLFNLGAYALTATMAALLFDVLHQPGTPLDTPVLAAAGLAALTEAALAIILVFIAISVSEGSWRLDELGSSLRFGLVTAAFSTGVGLTAAILTEFKPAAVWLALVPTAGVHLASRAYASERRRHEDLEFLYRSTRLLYQSPDFDSALFDLLARARDAFQCDVAELVLQSTATASLERAIVGPGEDVQHFGQVADAGSTQAWFEHISAGGAPVLVHRPGAVAPVSAYLDERGLDDAIVAPLVRAGKVVGVMLLADPRSEVTGFHGQDLRLIGTLANHVSIALENGRLEQALEQLRRLERTLSHQANHDSLTGLANRATFSAEVTRELQLADEASAVAILFVDLDDFKTVNDTLGHAAGDHLLVAASRRIAGSLRSGDLAARLGGDEFAVLVTGPAAAAAGIAAAARVVEALRLPITVGSHKIPVHCSIGVAVGRRGDDAATLLRHADAAMYTAKARGKRRVEVYDAEMHTEIMSRFSATFEIEEAIERDELIVYFQPIIDLASRTVVGAEALVRWQHPTRGLLGPETFIGVAEESDVILAIDQIVLEKACQWLRHRDEVAPDEELVVTVNLAARELLHSELPALIAAGVQAHGIAPHRLIVEVTESLAMQNLQAALDMLWRLKAIGVSIALDDFGTGYSSLSQLRDLPVDTVKIAKPFIDDLGTTEARAGFTRAIVTLALLLGKHVIAEGVEHPEQNAALVELGCESGQGYYFARPMDRERFDAWLQEWSGLVQERPPDSVILAFPEPPEAQRRNTSSAVARLERPTGMVEGGS